jgi:hypothetical protein
MGATVKTDYIHFWCPEEVPEGSSPSVWVEGVSIGLCCLVHTAQKLYEFVAKTSIQLFYIHFTFPNLTPTRFFQFPSAKAELISPDFVLRQVQDEIGASHEDADQYDFIRAFQK